MERPLAYLKKRADDNWLIGYTAVNLPSWLNNCI